MTEQDKDRQKEQWLGPEQPGKPEAGQASEARTNWERAVLERVVMAALNEQRRSRRWGIFFKLLTFAYLVLLLALFVYPLDWGEGGLPSTEPHTALVKITGLIAEDGEANAQSIAKGLKAAFGDSRTKGVVVQINSPGGSAVQAGLAYREIRRLRKKHPDIPLYAVVTDVCASGGYYIAAAADEIYADSASIVGSIGVILSTFGFVEAMDKLGVERRLITAGEHKGFLDPFSPVKDDELAHVDQLLENVHEQFIAAVKEGRGGRLEDDGEVFSGLMWTGDQAVELGLVDGIGSAGYVAREVIKAEKMIDYTSKPDLLERWAKRLGAATAASLAQRLAPGGFLLR